jgi:hypothetical protein
MANTTDIDGDVFDVRDVIARVEELEASLPPADEADNDTQEERDELATLAAFLDSVKGYGGDEQWRGDWYPVTFIRDSYFTEYAQELANDIGAINREIGWPGNCIDWEKAAAELQMDYSSTEFDGETYWYR